MLIMPVTNILKYILLNVNVYMKTQLSKATNNPIKENLV